MGWGVARGNRDMALTHYAKITTIQKYFTTFASKFQ